MHKQTVEKMCQAAHMRYEPSDEDGAWFIWDAVSVTDMPDWVPAWVNGTNPDELYAWMLRQSETDPVVRRAMRDAGMRVRGPGTCQQ